MYLLIIFTALKCNPLMFAGTREVNDKWKYDKRLDYTCEDGWAFESGEPWKRSNCDEAGWKPVLEPCQSIITLT
jgi:hypothetical protein